MAAVYGAIYVLRRTVAAVRVQAVQDGQKGVPSSEGSCDPSSEGSCVSSVGSSEMSRDVSRSIVKGVVLTDGQYVPLALILQLFLVLN